MEWLQVLTIVATSCGFMYWMRTDLKEHIDRLDNDIKSLDTKIDVSHRRMDQLYHTLIDIVK